MRNTFQTEDPVSSHSSVDSNFALFQLDALARVLYSKILFSIFMFKTNLVSCLRGASFKICLLRVYLNGCCTETEIAFDMFPSRFSLFEFDCYSYTVGLSLFLICYRPTSNKQTRYFLIVFFFWGRWNNIVH